MRAILISSDLMFISKVKEVASATGAQLSTARSLGALEKALCENEGTGVLMLDLEKSGASLEALAPIVRGLIDQGWRVASFFSHVHEELCGQAQTLGLGDVMPRSRFVKLLPELLSA